MLENASTVQELCKLQILKDTLLDRFGFDSRPIGRRQMVDKNVTKLLNQIRDDLSTKFEATARNSVTTIIDDYANALRYHPTLVRKHGSRI